MASQCSLRSIARPYTFSQTALGKRGSPEGEQLHCGSILAHRGPCRSILPTSFPAITPIFWKAAKTAWTGWSSMHSSRSDRRGEDCATGGGCCAGMTRRLTMRICVKWPAPFPGGSKHCANKSYIRRLPQGGLHRELTR